MQKNVICKQTDAENLQDRVIALEKQLAEARATISVLSSLKGGRLQRKGHGKTRLTSHMGPPEKDGFLASEEHLESALMIAPYPLMVRRDDGQVLMVNAAWTEITGYALEDIPTVAEWTRKAYGSLAPQRQSFIFDEGYAQAGIKKWGEFEVITRSGEKRIWDFSTAPLGFDDRGRELVMTMAVDVTDRKRAEENLRTARDVAAWLARFPDENPNPVVRVSRAGIVLYHNLPAARLAGWSCVVNEALPIPLHPLVQQALAQGQVMEQDVTLSTRMYSVSVIPVPGEGYANLYARDITEQKEAEKALAESRQRINDILGSLGDGLFALNREWSIIYVNQQAAQIAGYAVQELVGKNLWELWPELRGTPLESFYRQAMENRIPGQFRVRGSQSARWYDVSVYPSSEGITVFYLDKTRQMQVEEALRESDERFAKAFQASPSALVISRQEDGRIETVNDTFVKFFGYDRAAVIGKTSTELHMFANPEERKEVIRRLQSEQHLRDFALDVRLKSGEMRNVSLSIETMNIGGQNMMLTMIQDITLRRRAEDALRASEERYRAVVENALDAIVVSDPSRGGRVLAVNPAACRMFGYSAEEFLALDREAMLDTYDPRLGDFLEQRLQRGHVTGQLTYKRKDGTCFSGEVSSVFHNDPHGEQRAVAIIRDITEREQFEIALRKRESILAQAGEMAHLGAWDIEFQDLDDLNSNPLAWSDEVYRIFGYAPGEVQPSNDLFFERVHPDDRILVQESVAQAIATRQPYVIEHRIRRPDGEERMVQEHAEVFFDESGKPLRIVGAVQDITERKRAEQASRESEQRFRSLADSMPQLVWMAKPDGTVDYHNQRYHEYWGIKRIEGTAWEWRPVLHPEDRQPTMETWRRSVETGEIYQIEHRVRMADGAYRWHLSRGIPMRDEKGRIVRWFGTATDIHDLKLAEAQANVYAERLERSNQELEQFAFMASHDLQEPLHKIEVFGDMLLERSKSLDGRERNYLERMRSAAARMRDMVEGLLQLSRVTTQARPFVQVDLSQVTTEVLSDLEHQIRSAGGKVEVAALPVVEGDPLQLRQLMQNLIGNALKYHQPDRPPEVRIHGQEHAGQAQIYVEDQGIGFEQENAERIFQPFQRLVGRSQYEGSGMGLAICRRIVERHRGAIAALGKPGTGATFIVTLPVYHPSRGL